ncbi:serine hydrolase domain-containing protein [Caulobacter mirabilis]|uniref:Aminopeptidase n=1 Tax=Caulobacter mirabilis TaxID=69666 RepID=A0A2D2AZM7_9CAUL|nr:serine hydrolase domain-containing protein [Caulobacter mirabilis]ATQ43456.1 aminopeptidase [Caulobacter mirabilis]
MRRSIAILVVLLGGAMSTGVLAEGLTDYAIGVQPGCIVGRFDAKAPPVFEAAGYADLDRRRLITPRTQFLLASASKQFTALAAVLLAEKGKLRLDDPARRWLPEMAGAVGDATIEQLLHQTAGVRDHTTLLTLSGVERLGAVDRRATLAMMARLQRTNFLPGSRAQYSNGNYLLLSEIVARASGMPFERYLDQAIFQPLGMGDSFALPAVSRRPAEIAHGYRPLRAGGFGLADDRPATSGSGGVVTSMRDLARFDRDFHLGRTVWRPAVRAAMLRPGRLAGGETAVLPEFGTPYGAGLGLETRGDDLRVSHDGGAEGFVVEYARLVKARRGAAALCNRVDADPSALVEAALPAAQPAAASATAAPSTSPALPPTPFTDLAVIAGRYRSAELDATYVFRPKGEGFEVEITSPLTPSPIIDSWGALKRHGPAEFGTGPIRVVYETANGRATRLTLRFGRRVEGLVFDRVEDR